MLRNLKIRQLLGFRHFHSTRPLYIDPKTVEEVRIPMPWGHIAGKWWGDKTVQPILALHGILDNCATFDTLLPLINAPSVLAVDLLGHGQSSHIPAGLNYDFQQNIICLRYLIKEHFKWKRVDIISHSFGSATGFVYTGLYPDEVGRFVSMDCARFVMASKANMKPEFLRQAVEVAQRNHENPALTLDEHLSKFKANRESKGGALSIEAATIILKRNLIAVEGEKYVVSIDPRLPIYMGRLSIESFNELATRIKAHVLSICFKDGLHQGVREEDTERQSELMKKAASNAIVWPEGKHHAHLENPDSVAEDINLFFEKTA